jgi:hypothetical protein
MAAVMSGVRRSRREWESLIARAERSALSVSAFCAAQGISTASFYLWRKRLAGEVLRGQPVPAGTRFLDLGELEVDPGEAGDHAGDWDVELALGDGVVLRLRRR